MPFPSIRSSALLTGFCLAPVACGSEESPSLPEASYLEVTAPLPGAVIQTPTVGLGGLLEGLMSLTLAGESTHAKPEAGAFRFSVPVAPGIRTFRVEGRGQDGTPHLDVRSVLAGEFEHADRVVEEAAGVFLGRDGLQSVGEALVEELTPSHLSDLLRDENPLFREFVQVEGWGVDLALAVEAVDFSDARAWVQPREGTLEVSLDLSFLSAQVQIQGGIFGWIEHDMNGVLTADRLQIQVSVSPLASGGGIALVSQGGEVSLEGFGFDMEGVPDFLEDLLAAGGGLRKELEEEMYAQIQSTLLPRLEAHLGELEFAREVPVLGTELEVDVAIGRVEVSRDGLTLVTEISVRGQHGESLGPGSLAGPSPTLQGAGSDQGELLLSDNFLNLGLYQLWQAGALDTSFSTSEGTLDPLLPLFFDTREAAIRLVERLPPVVVERDGELTLSFGELEMELLTPGAPLGERALVILQGEGAVEVALADGTLTLSAAEPEVTVFVRESDWGLSAAEATAAVKEVLPMDLLVERFRTLQIPVPTLPVLEGRALTLVRGEGGHQSAVVFGN